MSTRTVSHCRLGDKCKHYIYLKDVAQLDKEKLSGNKELKDLDMLKTIQANEEEWKKKEVLYRDKIASLERDVAAWVKVIEASSLDLPNEQRQIYSRYKELEQKYMRLPMSFESDARIMEDRWDKERTQYQDQIRTLMSGAKSLGSNETSPKPAVKINPVPKFASPPSVKIEPGFFDKPTQQDFLELKEKLRQTELMAKKYKAFEDQRVEAEEQRLVTRLMNVVGCQTSFPEPIIVEPEPPKPPKPTRSGLVKFQRAYLRMWHLNFEKHNKRFVNYIFGALRLHSISKPKLPIIQSATPSQVESNENKAFLKELDANKAIWDEKESVYLKKIGILEDDVKACFAAVKKVTVYKINKETQTELPSAKQTSLAEEAWKRKEETYLQTISTAKQDIATYISLLKKQKTLKVDTSSQTDAVEIRRKEMTDWRGKVSKLVDRCRRKHFVTLISQLVRTLFKSIFILKAKAANQLMKKEDPSDSSGVSQAKLSIDSKLNDELIEKCSVLELKQLGINDQVKRSFEDALETQESIDVLRREVFDFMIEAKEDLRKEKSTSSMIQSKLAELRQENFEIKNNNTSQNIPIAKLEKSVEALKFRLDGLLLNSSPVFPIDKITTSEAPLVKETIDASCQTGFAVDNYEYRDLLRAAGELRKLNSTVPTLEHRTRELELRLAQQDKVLEDAKLLIADLRKVTETQTSNYVKEQRREKDARLLEVVAERRANKTSNKKATLAVAKKAAKRDQENAINAELDIVAPKIVSFITEWGSLKNGDIFLYKGLELEIDEYFNPSLRVLHSGQNGDKWEAQKHANATWYYRSLRKA